MSTDKTELELLKDRANLMNITFHPSIGLEKLKKKVNNILQGTPEEVEVDVVAPQNAVGTQPETKLQAKGRLRKEASKLVRIKLTCMNPAKAAYPGEIFTVSNSVVGTHKRMVPFNADAGWHVPQIILNRIKSKEYVHHYVIPGPKGSKVNRQKLVKEFSVEILDPLTPKELKDLAQRQAMANSTDQ
jgi:hypothetical protein